AARRRRARRADGMGRAPPAAFRRLPVALRFVRCGEALITTATARKVPLHAPPAGRWVAGANRCSYPTMLRPDVPVSASISRPSGASQSLSASPWPSAGEFRMTDYRRLFDLTGRKALVLGAASGIGKAAAEALAAQGAAVHCADLDLARAQATAEAIREGGGTAAASRADAANGDDVAALVARAHASLGRIDVAVTTPGINIRKTVLNYSEDEFDRIVDL